MPVGLFAFEKAWYHATSASFLRFSIRSFRSDETVDMNNKLVLELLWWIFTGVIVLVVLFPIYSKVEEYAFWLPNIVFIVAFITLTRYIFLLPFTFIARRQILKLALAFLSLPLLFYLIEQLNFFQTFLDEEGPRAIIGWHPFGEQEELIAYVRSEMLLFGVGSVISALIFPFRMVISVWRLRNRGTV